MSLHLIPATAPVSQETLDALQLRDAYVDDAAVLTVSLEGRYMVHVMEGDRARFLGRYDSGVAAWQALDEYQGLAEQVAQLPLAA